ncbi:hypothetical protein [Streptomyces sp. NPDC058665]
MTARALAAGHRYLAAETAFKGPENADVGTAGVLHGSTPSSMSSG